MIAHKCYITAVLTVRGTFFVRGTYRPVEMLMDSLRLVYCVVVLKVAALGVRSIHVQRQLYADIIQQTK